MARNETVWGIDIGNTSLKALRCRMGTDSGTVEIIGFDYIEHSKIMSQPGADPAAILAESLDLFLSRNNVKGEKIAISVSGQNTLWRFQPLPPIDPKKVTDLIKYEVKQWLPFDLQEVIWDYRQVGGIFEGNIALDLNIFMYAMKREVAIKTLDNYTRAGIDVDCIQGAQIALYNAFLYDHYNYEELSAQPLDELNDFDVILNVGTDTTEVIITNGVSVWLRNIPIGGNLFTKSLTKQLKLTFANAEHIKRNAATSQDPKAVILAMKPVFNDMLSEIDRSIKYYASLNKRAKFRKIYAFGNAMKLPGLRQFLAKSHGIDVEVLSSFKSMRGAEVMSNPQFKENISSFGVAYGLVLQLLHQVPLDINLIPKEILTDRLINSKKPWTLAAAALILLGFSIQYVASTTAFSVIENPEINKAYEGAKQVSAQSQELISGAATEVANFKAVDQIGRNLTSNVEGRLTWLELLKAINTVIPAENPSKEILKEGASAIKREAIEKQNRIYIKNIEVQALDDLAPWYEIAKQWYYIDDLEAAVFKKKSKITPEQYWFFPPASATKGEAGGQGVDVVIPPVIPEGGADGEAGDGAGEESDEGSEEQVEVPAPGGALNQIVESRDIRIDKIPGPTGPGRIVQLSGYHYHNSDNVEDAARGPEYVRRTILRNLKHGSVELPVSLERQRGGNNGTEVVTLKQLGIYYPILMNPGVIDEKYRLLDPEAAAKERKKLMEKMLKSRPGGARYVGRAGMMDDSMSMTGGGRGMPGLETIAGSMSRDQVLNLRRFAFVIQFVWQETPPSIRDLRNAAIAAAIAAAKGSAQEGSDNPNDSSNPEEGSPPSAEGNSAAPAEENAMGGGNENPAPASDPSTAETPSPAPAPATP